MHADRIVRLSQRMATLTLWFLVAMILLNAVCWLHPSLNGMKNGTVYAFGFGLTRNLLAGIDISVFPWWQSAGGFILSSIPSLALAYGLIHLRLLFRTYASRDYFSVTAANHFGKMGRAVGLWVILSILCEPILSTWMTLLEPVGHHRLTVSFGVPYIIALYIAACITVIARILLQASVLDAEHREII